MTDTSYLPASGVLSTSTVDIRPFAGRATPLGAWSWELSSQPLDEGLRSLLESELTVERVRAGAPLAGGPLQAIATHRPRLALDAVDKRHPHAAAARGLTNHDRAQAPERRP